MKKLISLLLTLLIPINFFGCSFSYRSGETKGEMNSEFTTFKPRDKTIQFNKGISKLNITYNNFKLEQGEVVIRITSNIKGVIFEETLSNSSKGKGSYIVDNISSKEKYIFEIDGKDAKNGSIRFGWSGSID